MRRIPALEHTGIRKFFCGPESFTPDDRYLLGAAPGLAGLLRRLRLQLDRHQSAGGAGEVLRNGSSAAMRRWIWRMSTSGACSRSRATPVTCATGCPRGSGCCTRCTGRFASTPRRGRRAPRRFTSASRPAARASPRPPAGRPGWFAPPGVEPRYDYAYGHRLDFDAGRQAPRGARAPRPVRPVIVRQGSGAGTRCRNGAATSAPTASRWRPAASSIHAMAERARRHRSRPHPHAACGGRLSGGDQRGEPEPGPALAEAPYPGSGARAVAT